MFHFFRVFYFVQVFYFLLGIWFTSNSWLLKIVLLQTSEWKYHLETLFSFLLHACPELRLLKVLAFFFFFVEGLSAFQDFFYNSSNSVQEFQFCHIFLTLTFFVNIPLILKNICWVRCFSKFSLLAQITHSSESGV